MAEQPKGGFYIAVGLVVLALIGFAIYRSDLIAPKPAAPAGGGAAQGKIDPKEVAQPAESSHDTAGPTTVKEYTFKPAERLPAVKGIAAYKPCQQHGAVRSQRLGRLGADHPRQQRLQGGARVEDARRRGVQGRAGPDRQSGRNARRLRRRRGPYRLGHARYGAAVPREASSTRRASPRDSRVMPRIYQQVDWSNGGDGIVVRENIKTVADLRGKKLVLAQNSPSHYFALNMLVSGGVQPPEVDMIFTEDAFQAAAAFNVAKGHLRLRLLGARHLQPLEDQGQPDAGDDPGANRLIADVWFARADFARDHAPIIEGLVRGIFDAMERLKDEAERARRSPS